MERDVTKRKRNKQEYARATTLETLESRLLYSFTFTSLAAFKGKNAGIQPMSLVVDADGNLFGTTARGGAKKYGTIFEIPAGTTDILTLASFTGKNGIYPTGSLVLDSDGVLWGTTTSGGSLNRGTIFSFITGSTASTITTVFNFNGTGGSYPQMGLVTDSAGDFYGTTLGSEHGKNASILFKLSSDGSTLTRLATFDPKSLASGGLVVDSSGNIFGTTTKGGTKKVGTVFEFPAGATGSTVTTLASFTGSNGTLPTTALLIDDDGNLIGTTGGGGTHSEGTLFRFNVTANTITTLASFRGSNGDRPVGNIVADSSGNYFGVTTLGGSKDRGVIFEYVAGNTTSTITSLYSFRGGITGRNPAGALVIDANDNLFGTTYLGGHDDDGTVFELAPGGAAEPTPSVAAFATQAQGFLQVGTHADSGQTGVEPQSNDLKCGSALVMTDPVGADASVLNVGPAHCELTLGKNSDVISLVGLNPMVPLTFTLQTAPADASAGILHLL